MRFWKAKVLISIMCCLILLTGCINKLSDEELATLEQLVKDGTTKEVEAFLAEHPKARVDRGQALHYAVNRRSSTILEWLLARGADANALDINGLEPLEVLLQQEYPDLKLAEILVEAGADVKTLDIDGLKPVEALLQKDDPNLELVEILVEAGAETQGLETILSNAYAKKAVHNISFTGWAKELPDRESYIEEAYKYDPTNPNAIALHYLYLHLIGEVDEAKHGLLKLPVDDVEWVSERLREKLGCHYFGKAHQATSDTRLAHELYVKAIKLGNEDAYRHLMESLLEVGDVEGVREYSKLRSYLPDKQSWGVLSNEVISQYLELASLEKPEKQEMKFDVPNGFRVTSVEWLSEHDILVTCVSQGGLTRCYSYNTTTEDKHLLHKGYNVISTKVLPNGSIALMTKRAEQRLRLIVLDSNSLQPIKQIDLPEGMDFRNFDSIDINGDISAIAYSDKNGLHVFDIATPNNHVIVESTGELLAIRYPHSPKWSPDEKKIMYVLGGWECHHGVGVVNEDGTENRLYKPSKRLGDTINEKLWLEGSNHFVALTGWHPEDYYLVRLPDGEGTKLGHIVYDSNESLQSKMLVTISSIGEHFNGLYSLHIANLNTGESYPLSDCVADYYEQMYSLSPDGKRVLHALGEHENYSRIYLITLD